MFSGLKPGLVHATYSGMESRVKRRRLGAVILALGLLIAAAIALSISRQALFMDPGGLTNEARAQEPAPSNEVEQDQEESFAIRLSAAARERTAHRVVYDPSYVKIPYPGGDVPADRGVCTDVLIRAYRKLGIDLQKQVHEDMKKHFAAYPKKWGLARPDPNIDHRRAPNLMTFFKRAGQTLPITQNPADYAPGDIVAWDLGQNITHIGIVVDQRTADGKRPLVVHNIGAGPRMEDMLFNYKIIGHFRYLGPAKSASGGVPD